MAYIYNYLQYYLQLFVFPTFCTSKSLQQGPGFNGTGAPQEADSQPDWHARTAADRCAEGLVRETSQKKVVAKQHHKLVFGWLWKMVCGESFCRLTVHYYTSLFFILTILSKRKRV